MEGNGREWKGIERNGTEWNQDGAVYQTSVGLAKNFKRRYPKHKKCLLDETAEGGTSLSKYYWQEKNAGRDP